MSDSSQYEKEFSDDSFWEKVKKQAAKAGREVIEKALTLYFTAQASGTPMAAKVAIYGALGYFISPIDAIPDVVPVTGYADDLGILAMALTSLSSYVTSAVTTQATEKLKQWFG